MCGCGRLRAYSKWRCRNFPIDPISWTKRQAAFAGQIRAFPAAGRYQREDLFSDGTLRLFDIIWTILDGDGLMLLEEPELYLHSEIVRQLPMFIANAQKLKSGAVRQVIISSHSYDLLNTDTVLPEEILILKQEGEDTTIQLAGDVEAVTKKPDAGTRPQTP